MEEFPLAYSSRRPLHKYQGKHGGRCLEQEAKRSHLQWESQTRDQVLKHGSLLSVCLCPPAGGFRCMPQWILWFILHGYWWSGLRSSCSCKQAQRCLKKKKKECCPILKMFFVRNQSHTASCSFLLEIPTYGSSEKWYPCTCLGIIQYRQMQNK